MAKKAKSSSSSPASSSLDSSNRATRSQMFEAVESNTGCSEKLKASVAMPTMAGRCDVCDKKDGVLGHNLQKCRSCGVLVHEICYGLTRTLTKNPSWQCIPCEHVDISKRCVNARKGGMGRGRGKGGRATIGEEVKRPTECALCSVEDGIHAMHPLYDTHGPEGQQLMLRKGKGKPRRLAWVHSVCAFYIGSNPVTMGTVYNCDQNGDFEVSDDEEDEADDEACSRNTRSKKRSKLEDPQKTSTHHFVIADDEEPWKSRINECRRTKCFICNVSDNVKSAHRIAVQCAAGDKSEEFEFKRCHPNATPCAVAMHVGCARWMKRKEGTVIPDRIQKQRLFFSPGAAVETGTKHDEPQTLCYCDLHARTIVDFKDKEHRRQVKAPKPRPAAKSMKRTRSVMEKETAAIAAAGAAPVKKKVKRDSSLAASTKIKKPTVSLQSAPQPDSSGMNTKLNSSRKQERNDAVVGELANWTATGKLERTSSEKDAEAQRMCDAAVSSTQLDSLVEKEHGKRNDETSFQPDVETSLATTLTKLSSTEKKGGSSAPDAAASFKGKTSSFPTKAANEVTRKEKQTSAKGEMDGNSFSSLETSDRDKRISETETFEKDFPVTAREHKRSSVIEATSSTVAPASMVAAGDTSPQQEQAFAQEDKHVLLAAAVSGSSVKTGFVASAPSASALPKQFFSSEKPDVNVVAATASLTASHFEKNSRSDAGGGSIHGQPLETKMKCSTTKPGALAPSVPVLTSNESKSAEEQRGSPVGDADHPSEGIVVNANPLVNSAAPDTSGGWKLQRLRRVWDFVDARYEWNVKRGRVEADDEDESAWRGVSVLEKAIVSCCRDRERSGNGGGTETATAGGIAPGREGEFLALAATDCQSLSDRALALAIMSRSNPPRRTRRERNGMEVGMDDAGCSGTDAEEMNAVNNFTNDGFVMRNFLALGGMKLLGMWLDDATTPVQVMRRGSLSNVEEPSKTGPLLVPILQVLENIPFDKILVQENKITDKIKKLKKKVGKLVKGRTREDAKNPPHAIVGGMEPCVVQKAVLSLMDTWNNNNKLEAQAKARVEEAKSPHNDPFAELLAKMRSQYDLLLKYEEQGTTPPWIVQMKVKQAKENKAKEREEARIRKVAAEREKILNARRKEAEAKTDKVHKVMKDTMRTLRVVQEQKKHVNEQKKQLMQQIGERQKVMKTLPSVVERLPGEQSKDCEKVRTRVRWADEEEGGELEVSHTYSDEAKNGAETSVVVDNQGKNFEGKEGKKSPSANSITSPSGAQLQ